MNTPTQLAWFSLDDSLKELAMDAYFAKLSVNDVILQLKSGPKLSETSYPLSLKSEIRNPDISDKELRVVRMTANDRTALFDKTSLKSQRNFFIFTQKK